MYNLISNNILGEGIDDTTAYGVLTEAPQAGKAQNGYHNLLVGNTICNSIMDAYDGAEDLVILSSGSSKCP
jgi:hypothetical protein